MENPASQCEDTIISPEYVLGQHNTVKILHDVLNVKNHICRSVSDHIANSAFKKIRNQLRNF